MNRAKLHSLGIDLPFLPVTSVGSFPKPAELLEARTRYRKGLISRKDLETLEKKATEDWIRFQDEIGVDILVDGEMYRGDMVEYFADVMPGFSPGGLVRSYGNRYYRKPIITGKIQWPGPITVSWWKFAQSLTSRPVKGMLTGPYTMMDWSFNEFYPDRKSAAMALAGEIHREVEALIEAGARIIQIDEPATSVRAHELDIAIEAMQRAVDGLDQAYFVTHICYGNFDQIYPAILRHPAHNLDLEMTNSRLWMLDRFRTYPYTKDLSAGVVDVHSHIIEEPNTVLEHIHQILEVLDPEQVWVDPDCGLKTRTVDEAKAKLEVIVQAARIARESL